MLVGLVLGGSKGDVAKVLMWSLGAGPDGLGVWIAAGWGGSVGICVADCDGGIMGGAGWLLYGGSSDDGFGLGLNEKRGPAKDGALGSCPIKNFLPCNHCTTLKRPYKVEYHELSCRGQTYTPSSMIL